MSSKHMLLLLVLGMGFMQVWPAHAQADQRCFSQTGYCMVGRIRQFWETNGGLSVFGYPIGPQQEATVEGHTVTVQWFERTRLELHPENPLPYDVLLGRLGADLLAQQGRDWYQFPQSTPQAGCQYSATTGHNICGQILTTWRTHGLNVDGHPGVTTAESVGLWGLPLSDLITETSSDGRQYQLQWFERARLELHPENQPPYQVLGGLLGTEMGIQQSVSLPAPTLPPTLVPSRICTAVPDSVRRAYRAGIQLNASLFRFHDQLNGISTTDHDDFLTMNVRVVNAAFQSAPNTYSRIFADIDSFTVVDTNGQRYIPDPITEQLGDRFVSGAIRPQQQLLGTLAFRLPVTAVPQTLVYNAQAINPALPQLSIDLGWPSC